LRVLFCLDAFLILFSRPPGGRRRLPLARQLGALGPAFDWDFFFFRNFFFSPSAVNNKQFTFSSVSLSGHFLFNPLFPLFEDPASRDVTFCWTYFYFHRSPQNGFTPQSFCIRLDPENRFFPQPNPRICPAKGISLFFKATNSSRPPPFVGLPPSAHTDWDRHRFFRGFVLGIMLPPTGHVQKDIRPIALPHVPTYE